FDAVAPVGETLERALQLTLRNFGFLGEPVTLIVEVAGDGGVLGECAEIGFPLEEVARAALGSLPARGDETHGGANQHGHDRQGENDQEHLASDARVPPEPRPLRAHAPLYCLPSDPTSSSVPCAPTSADRSPRSREA